jgi:hypothetical protein
VQHPDHLPGEPGHHPRAEAHQPHHAACVGNPAKRLGISRRVARASEALCRTWSIGSKPAAPNSTPFAPRASPRTQLRPCQRGSRQPEGPGGPGANPGEPAACRLRRCKRRFGLSRPCRPRCRSTAAHSRGPRTCRCRARRVDLLAVEVELRPGFDEPPLKRRRDAARRGEGRDNPSETPSGPQSEIRHAR